MKKLMALAAFAAMAGQAAADIAPADVIGVTDGGVTIVADNAALVAEFGQALDDTYTGTIQIGFTMEITTLTWDHWGALKLVPLSGDASQAGFGFGWMAPNRGGWNNDQVNFTLNGAGDAPVALAQDDPQTYKVVIDYVAGGLDTATITFQGTQNVLPAEDYSCDSVQVTGGNASVMDFTNMNIAAINGDTDGDGLPDFWEQQIIDHSGGTLTLTNIEGPPDPHPVDSDYDMDGATDTEEWNNGTDGTDPVDPDSDDDGLLDGVEDRGGTWFSASKTGTDPNEDCVARLHVHTAAQREVTTDFGGKLVTRKLASPGWIEPDAGDQAYHDWRVLHFGAAYAQLPAAMDGADGDGDGVPTRLEFLVDGRSPLVAEPLPEIAPATDDRFLRIRVDRRSGALPPTAFEWSSDLVSWLQPASLPDDSLRVFDDVAGHEVWIEPGVHSRGFFRLRTEVPGP